MVRDYDAARDRPALVARGADPRALDAGVLSVVTADTGAADGFAAWKGPAAGGLPELGDVWTRANDRRLFYRLVAGVVERGLARGYKRGTFRVLDRRLLTLIQRDFPVEPQGPGGGGATPPAPRLHRQLPGRRQPVAEPRRVGLRRPAGRIWRRHQARLAASHHELQPLRDTRRQHHQRGRDAPGGLVDLRRGARGAHPPHPAGHLVGVAVDLARV